LKILYDYQIFTDQNYGGISRYFSEIISRIGKKDKNSYEISSIFSNNYYLIRNKLNNKEFLPRNEFKGKHRLMKLINQSYTKLKLIKNDFDIFHPTYYDPYFLKYLYNKPYVITVPDLIYYIFHSDNKYQKKIKVDIYNVVRNSSHIITISNNTKNDIIKYFDIDKNNISVIYPGNSIIANISKKKSVFPNNYILFVGNRNGYKNFTNLVIAVADILISENIFLICIGGGTPSIEEKALLEKLKIKERIIFISNTTDENMVHYYRNALCFIFPSKYEGFGIPILESFSCGCPVILSNTSSFPEVAGEAALYFDPNSIESIKQTIRHYLKLSQEEKVAMRIRGFHRLKLFSWDTAYEQTIFVYEKLISNKVKYL